MPPTHNVFIMEQHAKQCTLLVFYFIFLRHMRGREYPPFPTSLPQLQVIAPCTIINPIDSISAERLMWCSGPRCCRNTDRLNKLPEI